MDTKTCSKCLEIKPITDFNKHLNSKDKLHYNCRKCQSILKSIWTKNNRSHINKYQRGKCANHDTYRFSQNFHKRMIYALNKHHEHNLLLKQNNFYENEYFKHYLND